MRHNLFTISFFKTLSFRTDEMNSESSFNFVSPATIRVVARLTYKSDCARVQATYKRRL